MIKLPCLLNGDDFSILLLFLLVAVAVTISIAVIFLPGNSYCWCSHCCLFCNVVPIATASLCLNCCCCHCHCCCIIVMHLLQLAAVFVLKFSLAVLCGSKCHWNFSGWRCSSRSATLWTKPPLYQSNLFLDQRKETSGQMMDSWKEDKKISTVVLMPFVHWRDKCDPQSWRVWRWARDVSCHSNSI